MNQTVPDPRNPSSQISSNTAFSLLPFPPPIQAGFAAAGASTSISAPSAARPLPASPTTSIIGATRGKQRRTAGSSSGRRGTFQTSGGGLGLLTPAGTAKKTLLGV